MSKLYKVQFEIVNYIGKGMRFYDNFKPILAPRFVPDEFWSEVSRETDNPWQQYNQLKEWEASGEHLIRNVKLFKMIVEPSWVPVHNNN